VDHDERLRLAADLTERLLDRHKAGIVAVGVHGSVARGDDGEESDLDLAVVTTGPEVEVLAELDGKVVAVRQGNLLATAFHPELSGEVRLHRWLVDLIAERRAT
jgi:predicted nucleotidyltransferase